MDDHRWVQERRWPDKHDGPFVLRLTFALVAERPEVVGVELWAVDPPKPAANEAALLLKPAGGVGIHTEDVRIPLRTLLEDWKTSVQESGLIAAGTPSRPGELAWAPEYRTHAIETARLVDVKRKGRADAHPPEHWQAVADVYLRSGTKGVAETWTVAKGTAAKWVWVARHEKGLLDPTDPGKRSGRTATPKGKAQGAIRPGKGKR